MKIEQEVLLSSDRKKRNFIGKDVSDCMILRYSIGENFKFDM